MPRLLTRLPLTGIVLSPRCTRKSGEIDTRRRPVATHMEAGDNRYAMNADRRILNPLYSDNRLKLGVFGANVSNGCAATTAPGHLKMTWPNSRDIVTIADRAGFEALVPVARWRGFGGATDFNGTCYDTLAWAAGMGAVTDHAAIFSTTHVPTIHPIVAAKQCTTVDHLTGRPLCAERRVWLVFAGIAHVRPAADGPRHALCVCR